MENSLSGIRTKTGRLAVLPIAWMAERDVLPAEGYAASADDGSAYEEVLTTSVWMYLLHSYLALVREHFGEETANAVRASQQAMLEAEAAGAASAIAVAFDLIDAALQTAADALPSSKHKIDIPAELSVALALLLGLPGSPGYRTRQNGDTTAGMPPGIDWFLSAQLQRGREQINRKFAPVFRDSCSG